MKKLFYFSASLFLLSLSLLIGFHIGVNTARADWNGSGLVVGAAQLGPYDACMIIAADGSFWSFDGVWHGSQSQTPLPIPLTDVAFFVNQNTLIDNSGNAWWFQLGRGWINYGPPPLVTNMQPTTWGNLKTRFAPRGQ